MLERQRLAVHPDRQQCVPPVGEHRQRGSRGPSVGAAGQHHVRAGARASLREQLTDRPSEPQRVADERAADLVGHARQRGMPLHERLGEQLGPGQPHLVVDLAPDPQRPVLGSQPRHDEGRVDAVEVRVRHDPRRHPGDVQVGVPDRRCGPVGGESKGVARSGGGRSAPSGHGSEQPQREQRAGQLDHAAPRWTALTGRRAVQRPHADHATRDGGHRVNRAGARPAQDRPQRNP